ncbi:MAG: hypothetical protein Ct9H300mP3_01600 [Gammaproteobacteria bacterium]|nr:MAG: hypothetical protein Ct9H300mP3_01600 [Gammaproteobacteria bacterium]
MNIVDVFKVEPKTSLFYQDEIDTSGEISTSVAIEILHLKAS